MYKITIMVSEPLVSDSLTDVNTPHRTNFKEMKEKMPWLLKNLLRVVDNGKGQSRTRFVFAFSQSGSNLYLSTSLDYSVVELNRNKAQ